MVSELYCLVGVVEEVVWRSEVCSTSIADRAGYFLGTHFSSEVVTVGSDLGGISREG